MWKNVRFSNISENTKEQAGAEMCQAHIKLCFGLAWHGIAWFGLVGLGLVWLGMVWDTCKV